MPITVRHEPGAEMAALAGLLGGQGQQAVQEGERRARSADLLNQLDSRRQMQREQIRVQSEAQARASDDAFKRDAIQAGLAEDVQQRELDGRLAQIQEEARVKASQWEYQYTTKQRQEIAKFNQADQLINQSDRFSEEEKEIMHRQVEQGRMGITPGAVPADPNKKQFAEGREPGKTFQDENGTWIVGEDGIPKIGVRYDQSRAYHEAKFKADAAATIEARRLKLVDASRKDAIAWAKEDVPVMELAKEYKIWGIPAPFTWGDTQAGETGATQKRGPEAVEALVRQHYPELFQEEQQAPGEAVVPVQQQPEFDVTTAPRNLIGASRNVRLTDEDRELPGFMGQARAFLRSVKERSNRGEEIPDWMGPAIEEATAILRDYAAKGGQ